MVDSNLDKTLVTDHNVNRAFCGEIVKKKLENATMIKTEILTIKDVARIKKVHHNTVRHWVETGQLAATRVGAALLIAREDLRAMRRRRPGRPTKARQEGGSPCQGDNPALYGSSPGEEGNEPRGDEEANSGEGKTDDRGSRRKAMIKGQQRADNGEQPVDLLEIASQLVDG